MDYQKFKSEFESSGLTQKAYGKQKSMSASMVSYYLRKAREESQNSSLKSSGFKSIKIIDKPSDAQFIKIRTSAGIEISIPI